ncbi:unnamed protein product [Rotaria sp. Silwood1]|nr:unnamed protein product [Rotaria sp. Silwood1]CAF3455503.1 unnamed protein product [Rotaria sp. Silwood1]CAF3467355.1 unnamed protein product [Rotaria sp. Silwood1]CAF3508708.1 unnamed protein product [Rotaria sp. Silwood1]CAF4846719.1 unnamed protein product [Rotaria sp. Silwood1]
MNEVIRLETDEKYQALSQIKLFTTRSFACLLSNLQKDSFVLTATKKGTVYRGTNFSPEQIEQYQRITIFLKADRNYGQFPVFTSTSRNREKVQQFGKVLFVIEIGESDGYDISFYSELDEEEHVL